MYNTICYYHGTRSMNLIIILIYGNRCFCWSRCSCFSKLNNPVHNFWRESFNRNSFSTMAKVRLLILILAMLRANENIENIPKAIRKLGFYLEIYYKNWMKNPNWKWQRTMLEQSRLQICGNFTENGTRQLFWCGSRTAIKIYWRKFSQVAGNFKN